MLEVVHLRAKTPIDIKKAYSIKLFLNYPHPSLVANPDCSILMRGQTTYNFHSAPLL